MSLMSITTTVSVAEPTRGGVPLSTAVTTKLWASTRAQHKVHRHVAVCVRSNACIYSIWKLSGGTACVHKVGECTCGSGTVHSIWNVWDNGYVQSTWSACVGQGMCTSRVRWGRAADGCISEVHVRRAVGLCPAPGTCEQAVNVGSGFPHRPSMGIWGQKMHT